MPEEEKVVLDDRLQLAPGFLQMIYHVDVLVLPPTFTRSHVNLAFCLLEDPRHRGAFMSLLTRTLLVQVIIINHPTTDGRLYILRPFWRVRVWPPQQRANFDLDR